MGRLEGGPVVAFNNSINVGAKSGEYKNLPKFGFGNLIDPETGLARMMFFRKSLRDQFIEAFNIRREALDRLFLKFDYPPLYLQGKFNPEILTNYFEQYR
jgi:hypothetical protein